MIKPLLDWLDHRTGYRKITHEALYENVPGGSRWRYVWGSTLTFALIIQVVTGIFLWMFYSASAQTSWESVYYVQDQMTFGWFVRGLHHYTAQAMIILLVLHLMQVLIDGAYKAPRELNLWTGLILLLLVLGLSLTGYLLPWDQKGYWATRVVTNIVGIVPFVGDDLRRLIIGGNDFGHHTLSLFLAFHAGVLPALILGLIVGHIYLFRRHGITPKTPLRKPDAAFWPDQVLKDAVACLAVLAAVLFFVIHYHGAELGVPANPSVPFPAARPEWYFLFLYQFLKYFPGETEIWGALVIPGLIVVFLFLMPFIGRWKLGHRFNIGLVCSLLAGAVLLTYLAKNEDSHNDRYQIAVKQADQDAARVQVLAQSPSGIPPAGAVSLLEDDPLTQGPRLFAQNCASCHAYGGTNGLGVAIDQTKESASDLKGFASREWLGGLLDPATVASIHYFGGTKFKDGPMVDFVQKDVKAFSPDKMAQLQKVIDAVSAEAGLPAQKAADQRDDAIIAEGRQLIQKEISCTDCHQFQQPNPASSAPDLTGYGSHDWLVAFLDNPAHPRFYGPDNDRMPAFGQEGRLNLHDRGLLADWLRGDWYEPATDGAKP
jgi:ubiquinol-cytochrome c reductase cytochrome b subunit